VVWHDAQAEKFAGTLAYYRCICVLILTLYMCLHTTALYVSSYYGFICVFMLPLYARILHLYMCPHTTAVYVSSY
jgi:hypothetical protein